MIRTEDRTIVVRGPASRRAVRVENRVHCHRFGWSGKYLSVWPGHSGGVGHEIGSRAAVVASDVHAGHKIAPSKQNGELALKRSASVVPLAIDADSRPQTADLGFCGRSRVPSLQAQRAVTP